jgi:hypothetical protein
MSFMKRDHTQLQQQHHHRIQNGNYHVIGRQQNRYDVIKASVLLKSLADNPLIQTDYRRAESSVDNEVCHHTTKPCPVDKMVCYYSTSLYVLCIQIQYQNNTYLCS